MRVRGRGFALVLVLVATATVFALAIQSGVVVRATTLEVTVLRERDAARRGALGATSLLIKSMLTPAGASADQAPLGSSNSNDAPPDEDDIELPPLVKALLGDALKDLEEESKQQIEQDRESMALASQGGGVSGRTADAGAYKLLSTALAKTEPVPVRLPGDDIEYRIRLTDAGGLLPINTATDTQLDAYLDAIGLDPLDRRRIIDQILDWRDEDSVTRRYGMERARYKSLGISPRDAPLKSIEELLYLPAMTRELFDRIAPDLSVAGGVGIHAGSASRAVLLSVPGITPAVADRIVAIRTHGDLTPESLSDALPITANEARKTLRAEPGNVFQITVEAVGDATHRFRGIAVVDDSRIVALGLRPA